jgi:hypothetical protein
MKKLTLFILAVALGLSAAKAQSSDEKLFHFGLNVTPGLYWLKPNTQNNASNGSSFGFGYGANLEFYFTPNYGLCTGLEVTSFKAKYTNIVNTNSNPFADSITVHVQSMEYLELPLLLKMKTNAIGLMKYFGQVGLNTGILLKANDNYTVTGGMNQLPAAVYSENNVKINSISDPIRLALVIGLGIEYNIASTTSLQASVNFDNGFLNINKSSDSQVLSKGVTLTVGVLF